MPKRKTKTECIWFKDHDKRYPKSYAWSTYAFGVCNVCRKEARKYIKPKSYPPKRKRKKRKMNKKFKITVLITYTDGSCTTRIFKCLEDALKFLKRSFIDREDYFDKISIEFDK